ncbi:acyl-CoA dehydrogenase family protein [Frisingicoccus sp.]|uniref:acyl-CoA dehydrogenase family protein n=1 Tax=Frisingicoccus sp. TaxID=1918627 RepID=UPI00399AC039
MCTYILNEEHSMVQELARELAEEEIKVRAEEVDHEQRCPKESIEILAQSGLVACIAPEDYSGTGVDYHSQLLVIEEAAKECASTALTLANIAEMTEVVLKHGKESLKQRIIPRMVEGKIAVIAGNDSVLSSALKTNIIAKKTDNGYVLNGVKNNVVNAKSGEVYLVAAKCADNILWFVIEKKISGLKTFEQPSKLGFKGCSFDQIIMEDCYAAEDACLEGGVWKTLSGLQTLNMAAIAEGIAQGAIAEAIQYVNQRVQFGKTIAQFQNTQHVIAELLAKAESARALVWSAAEVKDAGENYEYVASMAKLIAADVAASVTRKCVQLMGGYGYSREYPVERKMRDAKMTELLSGGLNTHKDLIANVSVVRQ